MIHRISGQINKVSNYVGKDKQQAKAKAFCYWKTPVFCGFFKEELKKSIRCLPNCCHNIPQKLVGILLPPVDQVLADHLELLVDFHRFDGVGAVGLLEGAGQQADRTRGEPCPQKRRKYI